MPAFLFEGAPTKSDIAAFLLAHWIVVGPVNQAAEIVPFIHAAKRDPIANADRHALGQVNIVSNQHGLPVAHVQDKSLMTRAVIIVADNAGNNARAFNPCA